MRIYYWIHHTGQYPGLSGIQRVVRELARSLIDLPNLELIPVRWCPEREAIVHADEEWTANLRRENGPAFVTRSDAGNALHLSNEPLDSAYLLIPEVPHVGGGSIEGPPLPLVIDYARFYGLKVAALFYDLIPIRVAGYEEMKEAHELYANSLASVDCVIPISQSCGDDLQSWWRESQFIDGLHAAVHPILLPAEMPGHPRITDPIAKVEGVSNRLLMYGTIEPRKNQIAVMRAFNNLLRRKPSLRHVKLDIIGHLHPSVAVEFHAELASSMNQIEWHKYLSDDELVSLLNRSAATIFLSLMEGYGLPVAESLWLGKPCITSNRGSMREIGRDGGCLFADPNSLEEIESAIETLAVNKETVIKLSNEARTRTLGTWTTYATQVLDRLRDVKPIRRVAIIEGSKGGTQKLCDELQRYGIKTRQYHWNKNAKAIIPGLINNESVRLAPGDGLLDGEWALLPTESLGSTAEALNIENAVRAFGMRIALLIGEDFVPTPQAVKMFATVDLAIFLSAAQRDAALKESLKALRKTATVRQRLVVAHTPADLSDVLARFRGGLTEINKLDVPKRIYYYCGLTAKQEFNSGIQRVVRQLCNALINMGIDLVPVKYDQDRGTFGPLNEAELQCLALFSGPVGFAGNALPSRYENEWLLIPEIVVPNLWPESNLARFARSIGMKVASICHDMIPYKMKDLYEESVRDAFTPYWEMIAESDLAITVSWTVAEDLRKYLFASGLGHPCIVPCPNGAEMLTTPRKREIKSFESSTETMRLLIIGTIEPRKNHLRLLAGLKIANELGGRKIGLTIAGRFGVFPVLDDQVFRAAEESGDVDLRGHVSDAELAELIDASHATIVASLEEGFGLPILESLWHSRPCMIHSGAALAEIYRGGGLLAVNMGKADDIGRGIRRLADEAGFLEELCSQASSRHIRTWREQADDIVYAMAARSVSKGWPMPAISTTRSRPLLTCAISTYNRSSWLAHSLPGLLDAAKPFGAAVQVVVCDNASTDNTSDEVAKYAGASNFKSFRNPNNVGMLGNLGVSARVSDGSFIWILGDDDIVLDGTIESTLNAITKHPDIEMVYMNYLYSLLKAPAGLFDMSIHLKEAKPINYGGPNRYCSELRQVAAYNENLFTAIYACAFRRDHAIRAYHIDTRGPAFSSMETCIPSSVYALKALQKRPAYWLGEPAVLINMNVSWLRWALLWHLERMPDLFNAAELAGIDPDRVDIYRIKHCFNSGEWARAALFSAEDAIRTRFSVQRLVERCKHLPEFRDEFKKVYEVYVEAFHNGRLSADDVLSPEDLLETYSMSL